LFARRDPGAGTLAHSVIVSVWCVAGVPVVRRVARVRSRRWWRSSWRWPLGVIRTRSLTVAFAAIVKWAIPTVVVVRSVSVPVQLAVTQRTATRATRRLTRPVLAARLALPAGIARRGGVAMVGAGPVGLALALHAAAALPEAQITLFDARPLDKDVSGDPRTLALLRALRLRSLPRSLVYGSTSGVYGDCGGEKVDETRRLNPHTPRSQRRVDAEWNVRLFGRATGTPAHILRIPGIYATDREGGTPRGRLLKGTAVLNLQDDVYTNHIHADDLARACAAALWRGKPQRVTNASDDTHMQMGEYFDFAAGLYGLPKPPRVPRSTAQEQLPLMLLSFMSESRRLENTRLKQELRLRLKYPTVVQGLQAG